MVEKSTFKFDVVELFPKETVQIWCNSPICVCVCVCIIVSSPLTNRKTTQTWRNLVQSPLRPYLKLLFSFFKKVTLGGACLKKTPASLGYPHTSSIALFYIFPIFDIRSQVSKSWENIDFYLHSRHSPPTSIVPDLQVQRPSLHTEFAVPHSPLTLQSLPNGNSENRQFTVHEKETKVAN